MSLEEIFALIKEDDNAARAYLLELEDTGAFKDYWIEILKDTEIKINQGILANNFMQTNIPNIYTAGDACESFDLTLGEFSLNALWPLAVEQGKIAGTNMTGENLNYQGSLGMNSIEFFGLPVVSLGIYKVKNENGILYMRQ